MSEKNFCIAPVVDYKPPFMVSGKGCYVFDGDGKPYLDISCGQFSAVLGHSNDEISKVLEETGRRLIHLSSGMLSDNVLRAAEQLHDRMPGMNSRIFLLSTGGEANEACLRYAKNMNNNKPGIISFAEGYHGLSHGTEGYSIARKWVKPALEYSFSVHAPRDLGHGLSQMEYDKAVEEFKRVAENNKDKVAAALFEPIVSNGGMLYPQKWYWQQIRRICDETGIYLIFDECQTGFGRTGSWFYYEQLGCIPDMLVCAKAMGMGFPISMVAFCGDKFGDDKFKMHHFSSHQNEPFSADIILCGMEIIEKRGLLKRVTEMGKYLLRKLEELQMQYPIIEYPRGKGLICGLDLKQYDLTEKQMLERADQLTQTAKEVGLLLQLTNYGKTLRIMPPYNIEISEIDEFVLLLKKSLDLLQKQGYRVR